MSSKLQFTARALAFFFPGLCFILLSAGCGRKDAADRPSNSATFLQISENRKPSEDIRTVEALIEALTDPNPLTQKEAARALVARGPAAVQPLIDLVRQPYSEQIERLAKERGKQILCGNDPLMGNAFSVRQWAIGILGGIKDARAVEVLLDVLRDTHSYAQSDAAIALGSIGDGRAVEPLTSILKDVGNPELAVVVVHALGNIDPAGTDPLVRTLRDRKSKLRWAALDALGRMNGSRAVQALLESARDRDQSFRGSAFCYLEARVGKNMRIDDVELVLRGFKDPSRFVRTSAARMIGLVKEPRGVEPLIKLLKERDRWVHRTAYDSLLAIRDLRAVEPIIADLRSRDRDLRSQAVWALGELGDPRAIEPLTLRLKDRDETVREFAATSLAKIRRVKG